MRAAYAAFASGDIPALIGLLTDDVAWHAPATLVHGGTFTGHDGAMTFFQGIAATWKSLGLDVEGVAELSPTVVVGLVRADGQRTDGTTDGYGAAHAFTIRNGKIAAFREYVDVDSAM